MDLYDDIDTKPRSNKVDGWSSGIKMLQTQLASKKAAKEQHKKPLMTPVVNLRTKKLLVGADEFHGIGTKSETLTPYAQKPTITTQPLAPMQTNKADDWDFVDEYDPMWPNEYERLKEKQGQGKEKGGGGRDDRGGGRKHNNSDERGGGGGGGKRGRRNNNNHNNNNNNNNSGHNDSPPVKFTGFGQRHIEEDNYSPPAIGTKGGGAAIAPPPSLQEISIANESGDGSSNVTIPYSASSVAAKIMAKYGFRDGQGLGKQEQGMSMALQVEKTSKRGGRIIHEKDVFLPPAPLPLAGTAAAAAGAAASETQAEDTFSPPHAFATAAAAAAAAASNVMTSMAPPATPAHGGTPALAPSLAASPPPPCESSFAAEPSITEIMKAPSKVVLLRNMVGPGDVDEELEPEVKDECNTKYGDVTSVVIHEVFGTVPEDAVKIYVEFKRIESAIKAVVDLNGRFFGGRQVRAGFYNFDKFKSFQLH